MKRTARKIEEVKATVDSVKEPSTRTAHPNSLANLCPPWPKGVSGNPGGHNQYDAAAELARAVIEGDREAAPNKDAFDGLTAQLNKGNGYVFSVTAERGYGKLKERKEITHLYENLSDQDLDGQINSILERLGLADQIDAAEPTEGKTAPNGHAKDSDLLPR